MSAIAQHTSPHAPLGRDVFDALANAVRATWDGAAGEPVFATENTATLFDRFLDALPAEHRQEHNCNCCRSFVNRYGGLVTVDNEGTTRSAIWPGVELVPGPYQAAVNVLRAYVNRQRITGVFRSDAAVLGTPVTGGSTYETGGFSDEPERHHFSVPVHAAIRNADRTKTAGQAMAALRQDYATLNRALATTITEPLIKRGIAALSNSAFNRSDRFRPQLEWLLEVAQFNPPNSNARANARWRRVALAPAGWASPRGNVVGSLLEDLREGKPIASVIRSWNERVRGDNFQRPQTAPNAGNIREAERVVEALGIERALYRRYARRDELRTFWTPRPIETARAGGGVFGHLQAKAAPEHRDTLPVETITMARFARTVLPGARAIDIYVRPDARYAFGAFTTAVHADAPPILQWDSAEARNPVSNYTYVEPQYPAAWGIEAGWQPLAALTYNPEAWNDNSKANRVHAVFASSYPQENPGLVLFPESLRAELHAVRRTIEAHSKSRALEGRDREAAVYLPLPYARVILRVTSDVGVASYTVDRWD